MTVPTTKTSTGIERLLTPKEAAHFLRVRPVDPLRRGRSYPVDEGPAASVDERAVVGGLL